MSSVDVIVPCYRYGQYLRQCVQSVLDQRQTEVRVLIIDDQSPDNTPEVGANWPATTHAFPTGGTTRTGDTSQPTTRESTGPRPSTCCFVRRLTICCRGPWPGRRR